MRMRCIRDGEGENGRTSWMIVCDEKEGERKMWEGAFAVSEQVTVVTTEVDLV